MSAEKGRNSTLLLKNLLFTLVVPGSAAVLVPWSIAGDAPAPPGASRALASALFALGAAIYTWCVWDFASYGRGTPAPIDAPKALVVRGLYRFVRNPMYLGVLSVVLAWAALFRSATLLAYAALLAGCFHLFITVYEEPHLEREFGADYRAYRARVKRWLPTLPRGPASRPS